MHKKGDVLTFLILGTILGHFLRPKKDRLLWSVFVFGRGKSSVTCDLALYLENEALNISLIYTGTVPFQYLNTLLEIHYYCH